MYYDHEGHAIATSTTDAASQLSAHEQAQFFGYDCYDRCCSEEAAAEVEAEVVDPLEADDPWFVPEEGQTAWAPRTSDPWEQAPSWTPKPSRYSVYPGTAEDLDPPF